MSARRRAPSPAKAAAPGSTTSSHNGVDRNGLERRRVTDIQCARMLAAMAQACAEHGAANVTVAQMVAYAGVSRRTFYEIFNDIEHCFLAAFEQALKQASRRVCDAYDPNASWIERMRASLVALLSYLDEDPLMGRLLIVESLGAGADALRRRQKVLAQAIAAVDAGREEAKTSPPPLTAEGAVGGVLSILHARLSEQPHTRLAEQSREIVAEQAGPFMELAGPLMSMITLPYFGQAAARRELNRPSPVPPAPQRRPIGQDHLHKLGMRLTYRTIRVLGAIAENPGSSNRQVADAASIADQGQTSKLLARLHRAGLIENTNPPAATRGEPNAWTLTRDGWQAHQALAQQTAA